MKQVLFRTDAGSEIGSGHVMRCLTLAAELKSRGWSCLFLCCDLPGNMMKYIVECGYPVRRCETATAVPGGLPVAEWLVIDHYGLDQAAEKTWRKVAKRIMVIDDLANRPHDCDLLLDQNYHGDDAVSYEKLVAPFCRCLLGPRYALLREEFILASQQLRACTGEIKRVLIFYGGSDPTQETIKAATVVAETGLPFDVVVGASNPLAETIKTYCTALPQATFYCQTSKMAELMLNADLAFGAGGSATWERCWLGLPTIVTTVAENQVAIAAAVAKTGAIFCLGDHRQANKERMRDVLQKLLQKPALLCAASQAAITLMGGGARQAGTKRVAEAMEATNV